MSINIAIDGPAGAGKSTIAKEIAKNLGFVYVDTGAMYRAIALHLLRNHISAEDTAALEASLQDITIRISYSGGEQQIILNGENVTGQLRQEADGNMAVQKALQTQRSGRSFFSFKEILPGKTMLLWMAGISAPLFFQRRMSRFI